MASAVIMGLGDAKLVGLSASVVDFACPRPASVFETKRPEQKAPRDLGPARIFSDTFGVRSLSGRSRFFEGNSGFRYTLVLGDISQSAFCLRINSCESPRAPPLKSPPPFC